MIALAHIGGKTAKSNEENFMKTRGMKAALTMLAVALSLILGTSQADAFWGHRQAVVTTNYAMPTVPVTAAYAPVVVARPVYAAPVVAAPIVSTPVVTAGYAPVTSYYAPATTSYYAPATTTYYAPTTVAAPAVTSYYAPTTSYYAPAAVAAPVTSYYAPAYVPASTTTVITRRPWLVP